MSERYLVTLIQLGIIQSGIKDASFAADANEELDNILDSQFVGNSTQPVTEDATRLRMAVSKWANKK